MPQEIDNEVDLYRASGAKVGILSPQYLDCGNKCGKGVYYQEIKLDQNLVADGSGQYYVSIYNDNDKQNNKLIDTPHYL